MRILRLGFALFFAVMLSQCALTHPTQRGDARADATDRGPADASDAADVTDVPVDTGPCGAATQRCCSGMAGERDGGLDGGSRACNAGLVCTGGMCNPCAMGTLECSGACVPLNTPQNCGTCGLACIVGQGCVTGDAGMARCEVICPSGQTNCGGACVSLVMDPTNCGMCGRRCEFANATAMCSSGMCGLGACLSGFENCNTTASDGCEANVRTSAANCGTCGTVCRFEHGAASCERGLCTLGACEMGFGDCDGNAMNGCETNIASSPLHCNRCALVCPTMGGAPACRAGVCGTSTCAAGRGDCDSNAGNGCETDLTTSATNCGTCGNSCSFPNAGAICVAGRCGLGVCTTGFANCDNNPMNGCEVNLRTDVSHCGMCPTVCTFANGAATCVVGACTLTSCSPGFANCDMNAVNGCEIDLRSNASNCGVCTNVCNFAQGVAACTGSTCTLTSCQAGFGNCDGNTTNGCEVNTQSTVAHCGMCNRTCTLSNATAGCALGACTVASCNAGFGDCDSSPGNGCETNTLATVSHCGRCGNACSLPNATPTCTAGVCRVALCNTGFADCDMNPANGCEVDLRTTSNCGVCGMACTPGFVCNAGVCQLVCPGVQLPCSGACVSTDRDTSHCGGCGRACSMTNGAPGCASSTCSITCNAGFGNCDGNVANGCEARLDTNTHCGTCGTACARTNASASCASGGCVLGACNANFANCDGMEANGCETALRTVTNCSRCGDLCSNNQAVPNCTTGATPACNLTCNTGFFDCNSDASDGCEVSLRTLSNCASCGATCARANATATCSSGACTIQTCNAGFGNCNGTDSDGCEANLNTSAANCRSCGTACVTDAGTMANVCSAGTCSPTCNTGFASCDSNPTNGCEVNTQTNGSNCGACGTACQVNANTTANVCTSSVCAPVCAANRGDCDGNRPNGCETSLNSTSNCGACGTVCTSSQSCTASGMTFACTTVCSMAGQICCGGAGGSCMGGAACSAGLCCVPPAVNCSGTCATLSTDSSNCGACGTACATNAGTATNVCTSSVCAPTCAANFGNCDGNPNNGCETDLRITVTSCGACGTTCMTNANTSSNTCTASACVPICVSGFGDCDSSRSNGCDTDIRTNTNCGVCGTVCATNRTCVVSGTTSCVDCGATNQICCVSPATPCRDGGTSCLISVGPGASVCCATGQTNCGGACFPLDNDVRCGACGTACTAGSTTCRSMTCVPCGSVDVTCCDTGAACGSGLACMGGFCRTMP